jgi:hypothetical protein
MWHGCSRNEYPKKWEDLCIFMASDAEVGLEDKKV